MLELTIREIKTSFSRFLAIFAIIALGSGFFCGLKFTKSAMVRTLDEYSHEQSLFDFELISTVGFGREDVIAIREDKAVSYAEGSRETDLICSVMGSNKVMHALSIPRRINVPQLTAGRMPEKPNECVLDAANFDESAIGCVITVSPENRHDTLDMFEYTSYSVVGLCTSPLYINGERGSTSLGNGQIEGYVYLSDDAFDIDYYTQLYLTLRNVSGEVYSEEYEGCIDSSRAYIEKLCHKRAELRYADMLAELDDGEKELDDARAEIADGWAEIEKAERDIASAERQIADGWAEIEKYGEAARGMTISQQYQLRDAEKELEDGKKEIEENRALLLDAEKELADGERELLDGRDKLSSPDCYVLDRSTNIGYACFDTDTDIVAAVAKVFPLFFYLVAALVCITTMTRMVDEQRTQLGVLKAIGYTDAAIMSKFFIYSGLASVLGCIVGIILGAWLIPKLVWFGYSILYKFSYVRWSFDPLFAFVSMLAYLAGVLLATWYSCRKELKETAASLIRPRAPKAGKRVFLERIRPLWKRLSFMAKVSVRNVLRYKQRMLMMIVGIGGCTALLMTAFGIRDSIGDVVSYQYNDISHYDGEIMFTKPTDADGRAAFRRAFDDEAEEIMFVHDTTMDCTANSVTKVAHILAVEDDRLGDFMTLKNSEGELAYPKRGECLVSVSMSRSMKLREGDMLSVFDSELGIFELEITGIFDNYVFNYVIVPISALTDEAHPEAELGNAWVIFREGCDTRSTAAAMADTDGVANVSLTEDFCARIERMMSSLDFIVFIIAVFAGALVFVVLFNLTNISITERMREIATVKVLGFYDNETAQYVFRENLALTVLGAFFGIPLGYALHSFVLEQIKMDMLHFPTIIRPLSVCFAVVLTVAFGMAVNRVMRPRLQEIDMTQALKSIE